MAQPFRVFDPAGPEPPSRPIRHPTPKQSATLSRRRRSEVTVGEVVARYLRHSAVEQVHNAETRQGVKYVLELFKAKFGDCRAADLFPYNLTDFIEEHPEWRTAWTRKLKASYVKAAFRWAAVERRILGDPFRNFKVPDGERGPETTDDLLAKLCRAANKPHEAALRFIRYTGCRPGEMGRALVRDMDLERGQWVVWIHKTRKKVKKPKYKALTPEAVALVRAALDGRGRPDDAVFLNTQGRPWTVTSLETATVRLAKKLRLEGHVSLKGIRHRYATAWIANGGSVSALAEQLGHENTRTAEKYYVHMSGQMEIVHAQAKLAMPKF